jgi:phage gp46-like protein
VDAFINPLSGDYELLDGRRVMDAAQGLANAVYLRLMTPLGSYWADAALGSRLHELQREKDLARVAKLARQYAEDALRPIIADGRAASIEVATQRPHDGRLLLFITVTDVAGAVRTFQHHVQVL